MSLLDFFGKKKYGESINDLNPLSKEYTDAKNVENMFTDAVDHLRSGICFPNPKIQNLMGLFWDLVGNRVILNAWANVKSMSFASDGKEAVVMVPEQWDKMFSEDPHMQICALVHQASQSQDFYNQKLHPQFSRLRGYAYEIEMMKTIQEVSNKPGFRAFVPNSYQKKLLDEFPGLPEEAIYVSKAFVMPETTPDMPKFAQN